jgi:hypothetical protein
VDAQAMRYMRESQAFARSMTTLIAAAHGLQLVGFVPTTTQPEGSAMSKLETIDVLSLSTVTGAGSSTADAQLGVQVPTKAGQVNVGGSAKTSQTDYNACIQAVSQMPGAKPSDLQAACGLPPSN